MEKKHVALVFFKKIINIDLITDFFKNYLQISSEEPLGVQFFDEKKQNHWTLKDDPYEVLESDLVQELSQPKWNFTGTRMFYQFNEYPF